MIGEIFAYWAGKSAGRREGRRSRSAAPFKPITAEEIKRKRTNALIISVVLILCVIILML